MSVPLGEPKSVIDGKQRRLKCHWPAVIGAGGSGVESFLVQIRDELVTNT